MFIDVENEIELNGPTQFKKSKQLFENQHLLYYRDISGLYYKTFYSCNLWISVIS
jgi:hypothetical protein